MLILILIIIIKILLLLLILILILIIIIIIIIIIIKIQLLLILILIILIDDVFFNRDWAGACRGRWAGPGLLADWVAAPDVALLCKIKKEEGSARALPVAAPMPKLVSL